MKCKYIFLVFLSPRRQTATLWVLLAASALWPRATTAQSAVVTVVPEADAFVWSESPSNNYGAAGALSVSGSAAANSSGQQEGLFDSLIRFPLSGVASSLDSVLGPGEWVVTRVRLILNENATPDSSIFNVGVGPFEVFWMASDNWIEGTGNPRMPTQDGVTWSDLPELVNTNLDTPLGIFTNAGANGQTAFTLALADPLVAQILQGVDVNLHLTAAGPTIGYTFNSRNFGNTNDVPELEVTAAVNPEPQIGAITYTGTYVAVSFETASNWTYRLQGSTSLSPSGLADWTDLLVVPPQPFTTNIVFQEGNTSRNRFYRLAVSP